MLQHWAQHGLGVFMGELCKVILVDDSEDDVFLFERSLSRHPRIQLVWRGENGNEAIDYLGGTGKFADRTQYPWPDVVVLDLKMPARSGFEVLEWMQGKANMPVVMVLSSSDLPQDRLRAAQLGATMYETKPFEPESFDRMMRRLLRLCERRNRTQPDIAPTPPSMRIHDSDRGQ
jgi:DNA-binding response OmpR family regulator